MIKIRVTCNCNIIDPGHTRKYWCRHCNCYLHRKLNLKNGKNKHYCIPCAIMVNIITIEHLQSLGYFPDRKVLERLIERKKITLDSRVERNEIKAKKKELNKGNVND